jgi:hypothetical protein
LIMAQTTEQQYVKRMCEIISTFTPSSADANIAKD